MSKLPSIKKILKEDIKDSPAWMDPVLYVINRFMEEVYGALNKDITFQDNIAASIKTITFTTKSTYPVFEVQKIANPNKTSPIGVVLLKAANQSNNQIIGNAIGVDWDFLEGNIRILNVSGLLPNIKYQLSFLVI